MANRRGKNGSSDRLHFLGLQITADSNCSHIIKRCLLVGRKAMTNLDCILKSRDITLLTMVYILKAVVSPVVMYGSKSWTIKRLNAEELMLSNVVLENTLESPLDYKGSNQPILKEINPEYSLEGLMLKLKLQ